MERDEKKLAEDVLQILYPLRAEWEDAKWLIDAVEKELLTWDNLIELANLLVRATGTVEQNERILILSHASEFARNNREKECIERIKEQKESEDIINFL